MTVVLFLLDIVLSFILGMIALYFPGRLLIHWARLRLSLLEQLVVSLACGLALLSVLYRVLLVSGLPDLLWGVLLILVAVERWIDYRKKKAQEHKIPDPNDAPKDRWSNYWPLSLLAIGSAVLQGRFIFLSGWPSPTGMEFLAWHAIDAPWHIYNIVQFSGSWPIEMTGFANELFKNYHTFSDLYLGAIHRLWPINPWHLYFRLAPFFYSVMLVLATFAVTFAWKKNKSIAYLAAISMIIMSNFGFILALLFPAKNYFLWDALFWVQPPLTHLFNPATSSSYVLFLAGCWAFVRWMQTRTKGYLFILGLLWGVLPGFKVYPGLLVVSALLVFAIIAAIARKQFDGLKAWLAVLPLQGLVMGPTLLSSQSLIHFMPGYNLGTMLVSPDRMNLLSATALKQLYLSQPWLVVAIMLGLVLVFIIGNLGPRLLALPAMLVSMVKLKQADPFIQFSTILSLGALIASIGFIQTGLKWNTIQFFYYAVVITTIIAAYQVWLWIKQLSKTWQWVVMGCYILIGLPGTVQALMVINWKTAITPEVYQGLAWLEKKVVDEKVTIVRPLPVELQTEQGLNEWEQSLGRGRLTSMAALKKDAAQAAVQAGKDETENTALGEAGSDLSVEKIDTAIVAAMVKKNTYLEDLRRAAIMDYPVVKRAKQVNYFYTKANVIEAREFLEQEKINYVIIYNNQSLPFATEGIPLKVVYKNDAITIYKFIKLTLLSSRDGERYAATPEQRMAFDFNYCSSSRFGYLVDLV